MPQQGGSSKQGNEKSVEKPNNLTPSISLPKDGGAIRGIDEKFPVNPATGTGSMSVPIYTGPGRNGFRPQLSMKEVMCSL